MIVAIVDAMIVPIFYPAYDANPSMVDGCFVILFATVSIVVCFHSLHRTRLPDRFVGIVSAAFSFWILLCWFGWRRCGRFDSDEQSSFGCSSRRFER